MTKQPARALILDDDPWIGELLKLRLESAQPKFHAEFRTEPDCTGKFDVYFIDNNFGEMALATELVHEIRRDQPDSLIVVFSGKLERPDLIGLVRADCDLVCEKFDPNGVDTMIADVQRMLSAASPPKRKRGRLFG